MADLTMIEKKLLIEALQLAEDYHADRGHRMSGLAVRNLRSRLTPNPITISYQISEVIGCF